MCQVHALSFTAARSTSSDVCPVCPFTHWGQNEQIGHMSKPILVTQDPGVNRANSDRDEAG